MMGWPGPRTRAISPAADGPAEEPAMPTDEPTTETPTESPTKTPTPPPEPAKAEPVEPAPGEVRPDGQINDV
jgi:hypothetical protein